MGFLEKLRESLEIGRVQKEKSRIRLEEEAISRQSAQIAAAREAAQKAEELHRQRRESAKAFREESRVGVLIEKLAQILIRESGSSNEIVIYKRNVEGTSNYYVNIAGHAEGFSVFDDYDYPRKLDEDSFVDYVFWDTINKGEKIIHGNGGILSYYELQQKGLAFETQPDGLIILHAAFRFRNGIPRQHWRINPDALEEAMEEGYNKPFTTTKKYIKHFSPYINVGWPPR